MPTTVPARRHYAWTVVAVTLARWSPWRPSGPDRVLLEPIEHEFGWSRATTSGAVSLNLVLYGLVAPFAAAPDGAVGRPPGGRLGPAPRRAASAATTVMTSPWHLWLLWGLVVGTGTRCHGPVFGRSWRTAGSSPIGAWSPIFSAANATGQLLFLPLIAAAASSQGWRWAAWIIAFLALPAPAASPPPVDRPSDRGLLPCMASPRGMPCRTCRPRHRGGIPLPGWSARPSPPRARRAAAGRSGASC